jgi:uncharacterized oligopeptide transporter (OPT) family protein
LEIEQGRGGERISDYVPEIPDRHPSLFETFPFLLNVVLAALGAIVGMHLITTLGISTNTSILGALVAIAIARVPLAAMLPLKSVQQQNLIQSTISSATFGAANCLLIPIGIPFFMGRPELVTPMLIGAAIGMFFGTTMLYLQFDSRTFPAKGIWPPGVATAEAIIAGDRGGRRALVLLGGTVLGAIGAYLRIPMSAFGVGFIGNIWALSMFGIGLLIRGYSVPVAGINVMRLYLPHGMMVGAGLVALVQVAMILAQGKRSIPGQTDEEYTVSERQLGRSFGYGYGAFVVGAIIMAILAGLAAEMPAAQFVGWLIFAGAAAVIGQQLVGLAAMHSGWFPAFAVALIFLVLSILMGFPPLASAFLVGYVASVSPAFADTGYDFKAGWILRGQGRNRKFELEGRREQFRAEMLGLVVALVMVILFWRGYFEQNLLPPVVRVYVATINAGIDPGVLRSIVLWAVPGAILQAIGGPARQLGILLATGLLIPSPLGGWAVLAAIAIRLIATKLYGGTAQSYLNIFGAGTIAGDALFGFFNAIARIRLR